MREMLLKGLEGGLEKERLERKRSGIGKESISQQTLFESFVDGEHSRL